MQQVFVNPVWARLTPSCERIQAANIAKENKCPPTALSKHGDINNTLQPQLNQDSICLCLLFASDILRLFAPFICDLILNVAEGFAINSSSMTYCFLSRWGLARQQCLTGKRSDCNCQTLEFHFKWSGVCVSDCVCLYVCVRTPPMRQRASYPRHHVGLRPTASKSHWTRTSEEQHDPLSSWPTLHRKTMSMIP